MLSIRSIVVATKDQVSSDLGGEAVILNLKSGMYYGLDAIGTKIWNLVQQPRTVSDIRDAILEEYDVESDRCEHDILALLQDLVTEGIIEINDATAT